MTSPNSSPQPSLRPVRWLAHLLPLMTALLLLQTSAHAHHLPPGFEGVDEFEHSRALLSGFQHPLTGWDHCLALLGIGAVAVLSCKRRILLPAMFFAGLVAGGCLGFQGVVLPQAPWAAAVVLFAAGMAVLLPKRFMSWLMIAAATAFGVWQGASHASLVTLPETMSAYAAGFVFSSAVLMYAGGLATTLTQRFPSRATRLAGAALTMAALVSAAVHLS